MQSTCSTMAPQPASVWRWLTLTGLRRLFRRTGTHTKKVLVTLGVRSESTGLRPRQKIGTSSAKPFGCDYFSTTPKWLGISGIAGSVGSVGPSKCRAIKIAPGFSFNRRLSTSVGPSAQALISTVVPSAREATSTYDIGGWRLDREASFQGRVLG